MYPLNSENFSGVQEMREKKKKKLFKRNLRVKSSYTPFFTILGLDFVARKVPLPYILVTRMGSVRSRSGGGGEFTVSRKLPLNNQPPPPSRQPPSKLPPETTPGKVSKGPPPPPEDNYLYGKLPPRTGNYPPPPRGQLPPPPKKPCS